MIHDQQLVDRLSEFPTKRFEAAEAAMRPGATMREVYTAAVEAVRSRGFPNYSRGHVGHSMGLDDQIEEPP